MKYSWRITPVSVARFPKSSIREPRAVRVLSYASIVDETITFVPAGFTPRIADFTMPGGSIFSFHLKAGVVRIITTAD